MDVALANPELIIVTRDGDRFASSGWRIASGRAVVTRSAVEESQSAARDAIDAVAPGARASKERRRDGDRRSTTTQPHDVARSPDARRVERLEGEERRLSALIDQLNTTEETLTRRPRRTDRADRHQRRRAADAARATAGARRGRRPSRGARGARRRGARGPGGPAHCA